MSEQIDPIAVIRQRWADRHWIYSEDWESWEGGRCTFAGFFLAGPETLAVDDGPWLLDQDEPSEADRHTLSLCAGAPGDIRALLARLDALEAERQRREQGMAGLIQSLRRIAESAGAEIVQSDAEHWAWRIPPGKWLPGFVAEGGAVHSALGAIVEGIAETRAQLIGQQHLLQDLQSFLHGARYNVETLKQRIGATLGTGAEFERVQLQLARGAGLATAAAIALGELAEHGGVQAHMRAMLQAAVDAFEAGKEH